METSKKLKTAWTVAGILAVLLVIMTGMWLRASGALTLGPEDLQKQRNNISKVCEGSPEALRSPECKRALELLEETLYEFDEKLEDEASTTTPAAQ